MSHPDPLHGFSMRQRQVLRGLGDGQSYVQIARELDIGYETVVTYARQLHVLIGPPHLSPKAALRHFMKSLGAAA